MSCWTYLSLFSINILQQAQEILTLAVLLTAWGYLRRLYPIQVIRLLVYKTTRLAPTDALGSHGLWQNKDQLHQQSRPTELAITGLICLCCKNHQTFSPIHRWVMGLVSSTKAPNFNVPVEQAWREAMCLVIGKRFALHRKYWSGRFCFFTKECKRKENICSSTLKLGWKRTHRWREAS